MKQRLALVFDCKFSKSILLPKLRILLVGAALLGFAGRGWTQGGTVVAWGDNRTGQATVPSGLSDVVAIGAGEWHNVALKADGAVVAWGYNAGVPGDLNNVVAIGIGGYHNLALKADGTVRAWGANEYGQANVPAGLNNVVAVKGGWVHSIALKADGTVVAWGRNLEGQATVPSDLNNVVAIAAGEYHNLALKSDGTVRAWGWNGLGQTSVPASLGNNVVAIAAGGMHSLALKSDGTVVAWGWNEHGQSTVPAGLSDVVAIAGGAEHSLALKSDGTVVGWGANDAWANNDPNCAYIGSPCPRIYSGQIDVPAGLNNVVAIAAGVFHSIALRAENGVQPPFAPALSVGAVDDTSVTLTWSDLANETGYRLEARAGANGNWEEIATPAANATSYQHTGLPAGTTMFYRLRAFNTGGTSPYSAEVTATTQAPPGEPPGAPVIAASAISPTAVRITWGDVVDELEYRLERRTPEGSWEQISTLEANSTTFDDTGLNAETQYEYRMRASNAHGLSPYSEVVSVTTAPLVQAPAAPVLANGGATHSQVTLSWGDVSDETGYTLERKAGASDWMVIASPGAGVTSFTDSGVNASTTYLYRLRAFNAAGNSPYSPELAVTTQAPPLQPPAQPVLAGTVASHTSLNLGWGDVANATEFRLERRLADSTTWQEIAQIPAGTTNHVDTGLSASTVYVYRLRASNAAGFSAYSEELSLTTLAAPLQPPVAPVLQAQALSHEQVSLSWTPVENETGFTLQRRDGAGDGWITINSLAAEVVNYIDTQVSPSTTYAYRIEATNAAGSSGYSAEVNVTTPAAPVLPPAAPSLQATAISPTEVRVEWSDVANEVNYTLERRLDTATGWTADATLGADITSFTESGLTPETTYVYRIRAVNSGGESAWSEASVSTPAKPAEVQASVSFVGIDDQTSGLWPLEFGRDGKWIASQSSELPAEVGVTGLPETPVVWAADSSEARALVGTGGTNRVAAGWSGAPLSLNLSIPRGTPRRIALYFVDWNRTGASQQVSIRDATTGTNLDTRSIEGFESGKYLVYDIEGNVEVTLDSAQGDAVLSGIFVGGAWPAPISDNPLTFRVVGADANGIRARISGDSGQRFKVQRTTDFRTWTDVANSILLSPSTEMTLSGGVTGGFFRTVNTQ